MCMQLHRFVNSKHNNWYGTDITLAISHTWHAATVEAFALHDKNCTRLLLLPKHERTFGEQYLVFMRPARILMASALRPQMPTSSAASPLPHAVLLPPKPVRSCTLDSGDRAPSSRGSTLPRPTPTDFRDVTSTMTCQRWRSSSKVSNSLRHANERLGVVLLYNPPDTQKVVRLQCCTRRSRGALSTTRAFQQSALQPLVSAMSEAPRKQCHHPAACLRCSQKREERRACSACAATTAW